MQASPTHPATQPPTHPPTAAMEAVVDTDLERRGTELLSSRFLVTVVRVIQRGKCVQAEPGGPQTQDLRRKRRHVIVHGSVSAARRVYVARQILSGVALAAAWAGGWVSE